MKKYICKYCGKKFDSKVGLKSHLRIHKEYYLERDGNLDEYYSFNEKMKKHYDKMTEINNQKRQENINKWILEKHKCENCGKIMDVKFRDGRFCSRSCANTRHHNDETKLKIKNSIIKFIKENRPEVDFTSKHCKICGKDINRNNKSGYCQECLRTSEELKYYRSELGKKAVSCVKNHSTWISRDKISYPERLWMKILDNNNIKYENNYSVKNNRNSHYYLDFYIEKNGNKIDLEIDGGQHEFPENKIHDQIRDEFLRSENYIVYRIKWNDLKSNQGKLEMGNKIKEFLKFYNDL